MKYETVTMYEVAYNELEKAIMETYGRQFNVVADLEESNDSAHRVCVDKAEELDIYDRKRLEDWKATGNVSYMTHIIMQDMVNNGVIPAGDWLIMMSW